ncbi:hypothetical protein [Candidatus Electrothrix sp.]|uniref:hypothetical protein n=1 Tax=Candidatus Electrothrix sp. TaxID=2170559 RepID=UPI0040574DAA
MKEIYITLAVEDYLSEAVARKLLEQVNPNYRVSQCLCKGGHGYLQAKINSFNQAAQFLPFFVLTDQDRGCPPGKKSQWLKQKANRYFIFRIAVMEVESWVMAHREAFAEFIGVSLDRVPRKPDELDDPKRFLLALAVRSRFSRLRADLVPAFGSTATVGPDYNNRLSGFIRTHWNVFEAEKNSESLRRAVVRIRELAELLHNKK